MTTRQIINILVFALVFVVPVIIRMVKAAGEAKERRRLEQMRQYQIDEAMRTGRPVEEVLARQGTPVPQASPQASAQERLRELAARRQAQIDALRRQRAQGAPPAAPPASGYSPQGGRPTPTIFQQGPAQRTGYQPQARPPAPTRGGGRGGSRGARRATQAAPAPAEFPAPTGEIGGTAHEHEGDVTHRLVPDVATVETQPRATRAALPSPSGKPTIALSELRRAIVLREVLGKPVALRDPGSPE